MSVQMLDLMAERIERVLASRNAPCRVVGGAEGARVLRFSLWPYPQTRVSQVRSLADDLAVSLRVNQARVLFDDSGLLLEVPHPHPQDVTFSGVLKEHPGILEAGVAMLGIQPAGRPLVAQLSGPSVAHILISGTTGSGKSVLLRAIATSLLLGAQARELSALVIDPKGRLFPKGFAASHLLRGRVITASKEALEALRSVVKLMENRDGRTVNKPTIAVVIDELADLVMSAETGVEAQLIRIAQRGRQAGIHLIAATQRPSATILSGLMRANFPLRLVGRTVSPEDSRIAAGRGGVGADRLLGRGDFVAVFNGTTYRFQAPFVSPDEAQHLVGRPTGAPLELPEVEPLPEKDAPVDDLDVLTEKLRPWWAKHGKGYGVKSKALRFLFGDDAPAGGYFWDMTMAAIERLTSTSTNTSTLYTALEASQERVETG